MEAHLIELLEFEQQRQRALTQPDLILLEKLLAEDLIHIHSTGMVHNKPQFLRHVERMGLYRNLPRDARHSPGGRYCPLLTGNT
ncbi:nuclear transport factor 2 family protein [Pantoea sp. LMR881]|uniref:nuclear transport factor 2 family protein n=1 Tax=Pantoea sp. LMR881 TaxID=3014336 RepID=UPI0022AF31DE|nr:nuclear transport factor 2 family protein [Pantoea sp. LMR881]MCZ4061634.1 nuclear transport factor 2 family protein [Pantoea sp. LMR881]